MTEKKKVIEGKSVSKDSVDNDIFKKVQDTVKSFNREDNIHKIL